MSTYRDGVIAAYERIGQLEDELREQATKLAAATERAREANLAVENLRALSAKRDRTSALACVSLAMFVASAAVAVVTYVERQPVSKVAFEARATQVMPRAGAAER